MARLPLLGTLINTATVLVGSGLGLVAGAWVPEEAKPLTLSAIGIVTVVMGLKMAGRTRQILLAVGCLVIGGLLGIIFRIPTGVEALADTVKNLTGGGGRFNEGLITASVLFCIGPMTLLGCLEDGLEGKIEILGLKSTLDLVASFFLAVTLGPGVLASALVVLVYIGVRTVQWGLVALGATLLALQAYVKENHMAGVTWNSAAAGASASTGSSSGAPSGGSAPSAPASSRRRRRSNRPSR